LGGLLAWKTFPELAEALPNIDIMDRLSVDRPQKADLRRVLARHPCSGSSITAVGKDSTPTVDASGTFSVTKRQAGRLRMLQAGVIISDYTTIDG
jgi:hypothetical protein